MKFVYTKHALKRLKDFRKQGVRILKMQIRQAIKDADHIDTESDKPKIIASKERDKTHILRVVFKMENDIITVITFYPAKKGRYYESKKN